MTSLSRQLAHWAANLKFDDLPPDVVDRAKGVTLHGLVSALIGYGRPAGKRALALMREEEAGGGGAVTVWGDGVKLSKGGAAFVNAERIVAGGKWDSFRMLSHPGRNILPAALAIAELNQASGQEFLTAIVAGYEVMERMAGDFIPSVTARGFHAAPVFGIFGAAVAAAKIMRLDEDHINSAIALCANLAAGNLEGTRGWGRVGANVRNALLAVALGRQGISSGDTVLEGDAGFYYAYLGNTTGKLSTVPSGPKQSSLEKITAGLGEHWYMLETAFRIYSTAGFNNPHVDVTARLCTHKKIKPEDVDRIEIVVNWLETMVPTLIAASAHSQPRVGSPHYYAAYGVVKRGFPLLGFAGDLTDPPEVMDLMQRVTIVPSKRVAMMAPTVTIFMKNGKKYRRKASGQEFVWDFEEETRRIREAIPGVPISESQFEQLIAACRDLDQLARADELIPLTVIK